MNPADFSEHTLIEQPAVALFRDLGYTAVSGFNETFGPHGTLGRETTGDVVLVPRLKAALQKLNPTLPGSALDAAIECLSDFIRDLNEEKKRGVAEQLTDEELAVFDILTKPEMPLQPPELAEVKKIARQLLITLKQAKLVLDWRKKQRARADVYATIKEVLDELPRSYVTDVYEQKVDAVYQHVFESYGGEGNSIYGAA